MRLPSLNNMFAHAVQTARRFPAEIFFAFVGTAALMTLAFASDVYHISNEQERCYAHIAMSCILVMNVALCLSIAYEARRITTIVRWLLLGLVGSALTWFVFELSSADWDIQLYAAAALSVHSGVALSAAWNRSRRGFWEFNKTLFLRTLTGALFTLVLGAGISLALVSLETLFNVDVSGWMYGWTWAFLIGVFNTLFVLGGIPPTPATIDAGAAVVADEAATYPRGLRIFTQFVLLPLVIIFLCILYAYGVKVLFFAALEGGVSTFILCLSVAGILAYLLVYPLRRETEHAWIAMYARWFGRLMVPLSAMLWVAIVVRVDAYGITEERYAVIALACVLTLISVYLAIWRDPDLRVIPASLLVASVLAFVGPFNMTSVSYNSQTKRAENVLTAYGVIGNGAYNKAAAERIPKDKAEEVASVVQYLNANSDSSRIVQWLGTLGVPAPNLVHADTVIGLLGLKRTQLRNTNYGLNVDQALSPVVNWVTNGSAQAFNVHYYVGEKSEASRERLEANHQGDAPPLAFTFYDGGAWKVTMPTDLRMLWVISDPDGNKDTLFFGNDLKIDDNRLDQWRAPGAYMQTADFPTRRVRFAFTQMNASVNDSTWESLNAEGLIIVDHK